MSRSYPSGVNYRCPDCHRKFDSLDALRSHKNSDHDDPTGATIRPCDHCGELFRETPGTDQRYCSGTCANEARIRVTTLECVRCGEEFEIPERNADNRRYCSLQCMYNKEFGKTDDEPDPDTVIVAPTGTDYYHLPDPESNEPDSLCGISSRNYREKDPELYPNKELCRKCIEADKGYATPVDGDHNE